MDQGSLLKWLALCADVMIADASNEVARRRAHSFASSVESGRAVEWIASETPAVLERLDQLEGPLVNEHRDLLHSLPWVENPRFGNDRSSCALVQLDQCVELDGVSAGILLMDRRTAYPEHTHPPSEMYLVVAGEATWRFGGASDYVAIPEHGTLMNEPNDLHGLRTAERPVLALWVLYEDL